MKKAAASAARLHLQVLLFVALLAASSAEYRTRPPGPHMRGPPSHQPSPHKGYNSPSKPHHQHVHFHQNSYSGPSPSFNKPSASAPYNRPMRYRKPGGTPPPQMVRPNSWDSSSYKSPSKMMSFPVFVQSTPQDRYKPHYSSGEPPAGVNTGSSSSFSPAASLGSLGGFESFSTAMDFKHLSDLSPIRTIPAPNLGPTSWPPAAHLGMGSLAAQSAGVYSPYLQHHSLDASEANAAALLAASKQHAHGYQVTETPHLYASDPDHGRTSLIRPVIDTNLQNDLSLRLSPYTAMSQLVGQSGFSALSALPAPTAVPSVPVSSLTTQDLYQLLNNYPLQQDGHNYVRQGQSAATDAAQLQSQLQQAQLQQAQLQQAQFQQAQLQQAQLQQLAALNAGADNRAPVPLRFSFDEQHQQLLGLPGRRGQHQELEGADSSQVLRLYHNVPVNIGSHMIHRQPSHHEESLDSSDSEVDGSEHSSVAHLLPVSPSPSSAPEESHEYADESSAIGDVAETSEAHYGDSSADSTVEEEHEDSRPTRIRARKNRDRGTS